VNWVRLGDHISTEAFAVLKRIRAAAVPSLVQILLNGWDRAETTVSTTRSSNPISDILGILSSNAKSKVLGCQYCKKMGPEMWDPFFPTVLIVLAAMLKNRIII
jgi:hypothetical protein